MKRWLGILACLAAMSVGVRAASASDAFLDLPLPSRLLPPLDHPPAGLKPSHMPDYHSYGALAKAIEAVSPKPVIFPRGWLDFVAEKERGMNWAKRKSCFIHTKLVLPVFPNCTIREYLKNLFGQTGLDWKYDSKRDSIVTDFPWHRDDPRDGIELLHVLLSSRPSTNENYPPKPDAWQLAFDAILSKPGNFSRAWPLRFSSDDRRLLVEWPPKCLVAQTIKDTDGTDHIMVLTDQPEISNPGPRGSVSYYLFDHTGRFESGGLWEVGYRCFHDAAWIESTDSRLLVRTFFNGEQAEDSIFGLTNGTLQRRTALFNGSSATNQEIDGLQFGHSLFTTTGG